MLFAKLSSRLRALPKRYVYPCAGVVLALSLPLGYFICQSLMSGLLPLAAVWEMELAHDPFTYGYLFVATALLFVVIGYRVGRREDRLRRAASTATPS